MIIERPLLSQVEVQALIGSTWTPLLADGTSMTIRRGGSRDGFGIKTDVGLCTFNLLNAQDPMHGGALTPGMPLRVLTPPLITEHPAAQVYATTFTTGLDGWVAAGGSVMHFSSSFTPPECMYVSGATNRAQRSLLGLFEVGRSYTVRARFRKGTAASGTIGLLGYPTAATVTPTDANFTPVSFSFTAVSPSYTLYVSNGSNNGYWDEIAVTRDAWTEETLQPIFTGRIKHLQSRYPLNKSTGESRAYVEVTAADAVSIHTATQRYGVDLGTSLNETFESRIGRLASSAQAAIDVPVQGAPLEVYRF
ncbi:hypothetical protein JVX92_00690 [Microbacterium hominis]|uniref:hypothetical protein n=1 Tax=Microbacterium hominis TaxID=162426 RepID=UPI0019669735|nr:hypothetical protein [Microbacterium hominis]QRY40845.1 hypothetical protein JVX92_00690 [Microbacterium hominis]